MVTTTSQPHGDSSYATTVVDTYTAMPGTPGRASRQDRRLARHLQEQGVPLHLVIAAIIVGAARRLFRDHTRASLAPVRTLAYFLPLVDEMREYPPDPDYVAYVRAKLAGR